MVIAGALVLEPQMIVADEPVSNLDASVRGEILRLLLELRDTLGLTILVVTHDLGLAWTIADRVAVMYLGRIVEIGPTEECSCDRCTRTRRRSSTWSRRPAASTARSFPASRPTRPASPTAAGSTLAAPIVASGQATVLGIEAKCKTEDLGLLELGNEHFAACHAANLDTSAAAAPAPARPS